MPGTAFPLVALSLIGFAVGAAGCASLFRSRYRRGCNGLLAIALGCLSLRQLAYAAATASWLATGVCTTTGTICFFVFWPALFLYVSRSVTGTSGLGPEVLTLSSGVGCGIVVAAAANGLWFPHEPPLEAGLARLAVYATGLAATGGLAARTVWWPWRGNERTTMSQMKHRWLSLITVSAAALLAATIATVVLSCVRTNVHDMTPLVEITAEVAFLQLVVPAVLLNPRVLLESAEDARQLSRLPSTVGVIRRDLTGYMQNHRPYLRADLRVSDLAAAVGVPSHVLSLLIKREFGSNFADFVNGYRVREAERLLLDPDREQFTIHSLALEVGFASKAPFNRAFKRQTGQTPSDYRRNRGAAPRAAG